ncbi:hypothetical protein Cni_G08956 [Canna indica]|uniref:Fe2OG dioxygenase domain-containing protein n=1 Tax=Canna indica TaxID=4628 RepID=A0AAQ3K1L8_9LILI|nr:hypothetical protein Cni_G08956 [Canna indica]
MAGEVSFSNMGTSIPVDNVQALAASIYDQGSTSVPPRYLRPEAKTTDPIASDGEKIEPPVIDFARLIDCRTSQEESAKLHNAFAGLGFVQLINHGVPDEVIEKLKADIIDFFNLPLEEKKAVAQLPNDLQGYGQAFVVSEDQKLDWGDMLFLMTRPLHIRNMRFWPTRPPTFRDTLSSYSVELKRVAATLFELIAKCLGIAPEELLDIFEDLPQGARFNYYPPSPKADEVLGLSPHSDATPGLTLLLQVNDVPGLQIKHQGKWFLVDPLPGAFLVNVGDMLEILSNGEYKSIEHRAIVNTRRERLSVAAFHFPKEDAVIGPLPGLVKEGKAKYKSENYRALMKAFYGSKLDGKSLVERLKLKLISSCKLTVISNTMAGEPSFQNMGTSIPVANVQALAASIADSSSIPPRYIRPEAKTDLVARADEGELPVIDFGRLLDPGFSQQESAKLHDACVEWGFFHLINHQVPEEVVEKMKADIADFFKLPLEERKKVAQLPNNIEGYGQAFVVSDEQKLDWADIIFLLTRPLHLRNMRFWPSQPLSFRLIFICFIPRLIKPEKKNRLLSCSFMHGTELTQGHALLLLYGDEESSRHFDGAHGQKTGG